jgi:hypothetical protein
MESREPRDALPAPVRELQERIDAALRETPEDRAASTFSDYLPGPATRLGRLLAQAAAPGGTAGLTAALDEFDRLRASGEDPLALQRALSILITHHPEAARLGLSVPDLADRAPWAAVPSRRER